MKSAVLEFQRNRAKRQQAEGDSIDILDTLAELRSYLQSIEKAIRAVERLAVARMENPLGPRKVSRKKKATAAAAKPLAQTKVRPIRGSS